MTPYQQHVIDNPYLFTSPCAEKFNCSHREDNKHVCKVNCQDLSLYLQVLDFYGYSGLGGLSVGHVYQSANPIEDDGLVFGIETPRGNKKPMLEEY